MKPPTIFPYISIIYAPDVGLGLVNTVVQVLPHLSPRQADFWGWVKSDFNTKHPLAYKSVPVSQSMYYPENI
jgi:hypothetical protein